MKKGIILNGGYFEDSKGRLINLKKHEEVDIIQVKGNFIVDFIFEGKLFKSDLNFIEIIN